MTADPPSPQPFPPVAAKTPAVALGYIRAHILMTEAEIAGARAFLTGFADQRGLTLDEVYVEQPHLTPAAYEALTDALVDRPDVAAVIVPTLQHLAVGISPNFVRKYLEQAAGIEVLVMADGN